MVGMASENAGGAPQLFGKHRAGEHVRPGHGTEGDEEIGFRAPRLAVPVGSADQESRLAHAIVAPAAKQGGELL